MDGHVPRRLAEALGLEGLAMVDGGPGRQRELGRAGGGVPGPARLDLPVPDDQATADAARNEMAARAALTKRDAITAGRIALLQAFAMGERVRELLRQGKTHGEAATREEQTPQAVRRCLRLLQVAAANCQHHKAFYSTLDEHGARELMTLMEAEMVAGIRDLETGHRLAEYAE